MCPQTRVCPLEMVQGQERRPRRRARSPTLLVGASLTPRPRPRSGSGHRAGPAQPVRTATVTCHCSGLCGGHSRRRSLGPTPAPALRRESGNRGGTRPTQPAPGGDGASEAADPRGRARQHRRRQPREERAPRGREGASQLHAQTLPGGTREPTDPHRRARGGQSGALPAAWARRPRCGNRLWHSAPRPPPAPVLEGDPAGGCGRLSNPCS